MVSPILYLGELLKETYLRLAETFSSMLGDTSMPQLLARWVLDVGIFLIFGFIVVYTVESSNNSRIRKFSRQQAVGMIRDQIKYRKVEERVVESKWYLDAFTAIHEDLVKKSEASEGEKWGGDMEKKRVLLQDVEEYADFV